MKLSLVVIGLSVGSLILLVTADQVGSVIWFDDDDDDGNDDEI